MDTKTRGESPLDEFLLETDGLSEATETDGIPGGNDEEAARALRELGQLEQRMNANSDIAGNQRAKITEWETAVNEPLQKRALWLRSLLEAYARAEREGSKDKKKSVTTPFGIVKTMPAQPKWEIEDLEAFTAWAQQENPALIETKVTAKLAEIKKALSPIEEEAVTEEGEVLDGVMVIRAADPISGKPVPGITITPAAAPYTYTIKTT